MRTLAARLMDTSQGPLTGQIKVGYSDEIGLGNATGSAGADSSPRASLFTIRPLSVVYCPFYGVTP